MPDRLQAVFWPGAPVPSRGSVALWGPEDLADQAAALGFPAGRTAQLTTVLPASPRAYLRVRSATVPARLIGVLDAARALAALPSAAAPAHAWPERRRPSDSLLAWSVAAKLACELVAQGASVPTLRPAGEAAVAGWRLATSSDARWADLSAAFPPAAHALPTDDDDGAVHSARALLDAFGDAVADACARTGAARQPPARKAPAGQAAARRAPAGPAAGRQRATSWPQSWTQGLAGDDPVLAAEQTAHTTTTIADRAEELTAWAAPALDGAGRGGARLCLRLDTPPPEAEPDAPWPLAYLLQAADDPSLVVGAERVWQRASAALDLGDRKLGDPQEALVRGLAEAARLFPPIAASLRERAPAALDLDPGAVAELLGAATELARAGLGLLLPAELTAEGQRRLRARLRVGAQTAAPGAEVGAGLGAEQLVDFAWEVALGEDTLSAAEFAEIAAAKQPIVRWRGRWVRVDPDEALTLADLAGTAGTMTRTEALAAALSGEQAGTGLGAVEAVADGGLATLVERLREGAASADDPRLDGIEATLRDYQRRGAAWLQVMAGGGFGGVLADDMGLGKTLQAITLLRSRAGDRPSLVVCPTSVLGNWERELARFAPGLPVVRHHGLDRPAHPDGFPPGSVAVTSYGLVRRDADLLASVDWDVVVLDEAQQVKNHTAKAARAVRRLPSRARLAMTGTPVENRLAELWAILDFTNPGLLGPYTRFRERYAIPIERWGDDGAATRLRQLVAPFLLRRLKTDPAVAADLPAKREATVVCSLTREQATLYQAAVDWVFGKGLAEEGIDRRGQILALLTALKQICNHPAHYLGETGPLPRRSGKLARTEEMLAEVIESGDAALVFTQYRRMGELLGRHLSQRLGLPAIPFLHGGVPRAKRDAMVEAFQGGADGPPLLLVSIKAGGAGLNLTRATHVVHYDRWWNPAVEDQATDRAHRIGQTRSVAVHKLVSAGTVEERVADLLERKRALADAVVGSGETWLTELDDGALHDLVALSAADVADAEEAE